LRKKKGLSVYRCGFCFICNKELLSNMGGWIINAERRHFCYAGEDNCFDRYLQNNLRLKAEEKQI